MYVAATVSKYGTDNPMNFLESKLIHSIENTQENIDQIDYDILYTSLK